MIRSDEPIRWADLMIRPDEPVRWSGARFVDAASKRGKMEV